jgi:hypothetical protein
MRTSNLANEAVRQADVGQVWEEVLSGAQGTIKLKTSQTFRVRAAGATTVTIDGTLAMTMVSGEIAIFNAGSGQPNASTLKPASEVVVVIAGANAFVQVARENVRKV